MALHQGLLEAAMASGLAVGALRVHAHIQEIANSYDPDAGYGASRDLAEFTNYLSRLSERSRRASLVPLPERKRVYAEIEDALKYCQNLQQGGVRPKELHAYAAFFERMRDNNLRRFDRARQF